MISPSIYRLSREVRAGLFQYPPAMFSEIWPWIRATLAGHVLYETNHRIQMLTKEVEIYEDKIKEIALTSRLFERDLDRLGGGEYIKLTVYKAYTNRRTNKREILPIGVYIKKGDRAYHKFTGQTAHFPSGLPEGDEQNWEYLYEVIVTTKKRVRFEGWADLYRSTVVKRVENQIQSSKKELQNYIALISARTKVDMPTLVTQKLLQRELLKYTSKPKHYASSASSNFDIDLTGWKYTRDIPDPEGKLSGHHRGLRVKIYFTPHKNRAGAWIPDKSEIQVDAHGGAQITDVGFFREVLDYMRDAFEHELRHAAQDYLAIIKSLGEEAGLPSRGIRDPDIDPSGVRRDLSNRWYRNLTREDHKARDVEFYPRLGDEVAEFIRFAKKERKNLRRVAMKIWVGEADAWDYPDLTQNWKPSPWFKWLRSSSRHKARYRAAVTEFVSQVTDKLYMP